MHTLSCAYMYAARWPDECADVGAKYASMLVWCHWPPSKRQRLLLPSKVNLCCWVSRVYFHAICYFRHPLLLANIILHFFLSKFFTFLFHFPLLVAFFFGFYRRKWSIWNGCCHDKMMERQLASIVLESAKHKHSHARDCVWCVCACGRWRWICLFITFSEYAGGCPLQHAISVEMLSTLPKNTLAKYVHAALDGVNWICWTFWLFIKRVMLALV